MIGVPTNLDEILATAEELKVTSVSLEYDSAGDLEVTYFVGSNGLGFAVSRQEDRKRIISELFDRVDLETKERGAFRWRGGNGGQTIRVTQREHFGEWAYDLRFRRT